MELLTKSRFLPHRNKRSHRTILAAWSWILFLAARSKSPLKRSTNFVSFFISNHIYPLTSF
ncbi:hypothetical protein CW304_25270 [Bacillus sp. UFRGS-B20]|nr:hypothetical protein CW304_25270 [Bacillus sp. UFRGS-B20]